MRCKLLLSATAFSLAWLLVQGTTGAESATPSAPHEARRCSPGIFLKTETSMKRLASDYRCFAIA